MTWTHEFVGPARAANGREKAAGPADAALALVVAGELKVLSLLLSDALYVMEIVDCHAKHKEIDTLT